MKVDFYHGAKDPLAAACQLISDFYVQGCRVLVYVTDESMLVNLDCMLWTQSALSFVPHCRVGSPLQEQTSVVISDTLDVLGYDDVLVNVGGDLSVEFGRFARCVEVVGTDERAKSSARARYKAYREQAYVIEAHDLSAG